CLFHSDPGRAAALGSRGGRRRAIFNPDELPQFDAPKTAGDLGAIVAQVIVYILAGRLDPKVGHAIASLASNFLRAHEVSVLEVQVAELKRVQDEAREAGSTATLPPVYDTVFQTLKQKNKRLQEESNGSSESEQSD